MTRKKISYLNGTLLDGAIQCLTWHRARSFSDAPMSYFPKAALAAGAAEFPFTPFPFPSSSLPHSLSTFLFSGAAPSSPFIQSHELKARKEAIFRKAERTDLLWSGQCARIVIAACFGRDIRGKQSEKVTLVCERCLPDIVL